MKKTVALLFSLFVMFACNQGSKDTKADSGKETKTEGQPTAQEISDPISYALGHRIGSDLKTTGVALDMATLSKGIEDGMNDKQALEPEVLAKAQQDFQDEARKNMEAKQAEAATKNVGEAVAFLEENGKKEGVKTTDSGLQYEVITMGTGKKPKETDKVRVHYMGTLINGTEFDSSYKRNKPAEFPLNGVIKGWTEGLQLMPAGSKFKFFIPPELGYGVRGAGQIPPNAALIFEVELLDVL